MSFHRHIVSLSICIIISVSVRGDVSMGRFALVLERYCQYMMFTVFWITITGGKGFVAQCEMAAVNVLILYIIHETIWKRHTRSE